MVSKESLRRASLILVMTAMSACTATVNGGGGPGPGDNGIPATCMSDSSVVGCVGAAGYSCTGADSPDQSDTSLSCSSGTPSGGETLYCCIDATSVASGCSVDANVVGCAGGSIGFSCTGSAEPQQGNTSLVCSSGTPSGGANLFCCANYAPSMGTCAQDSTVVGCDGSSIGFTCTGTDTPAQVNASLNCSTGTASSAGTAYCCQTAAGPPATTTAMCASDGAVMCTAPATGYSCTGGEAPTTANPALSCGAGTAEADGTTLAYCCNTGGTTAPACAADPSVTGCVMGSDGYTCTGGLSPETGSSLLCGQPMAAANGAQSYCCATN